MILHVDMDAFYASVEERDDPGLAGKPVIVGGAPERRGVVCAANYAARKYGVHSAMPAATARRLCPHAVFLPVRMQHYAEVSKQIHAVFERYTPLVEPLSLDEAFLDVAGSQNLFGPAAVIGRRIKEDIRGEIGLIASVGVAPNKFLAKVASDMGKPDGYVVVDTERIHDFLDPLPVSQLWGVGKVTGKVFEKLGISTIGELRRMSLEAVRKHFGKSGEHFWQLAHGVDDRRVVPDREAKSISHETTFERDIADVEVLRMWLLELTEQVARRLRRHGLAGRTIHLKVRFADFRAITRSQTIAEATDITQELWQAAVNLLSKRMPARHGAVRLLGMGVSGLEGAGQQQGALFDGERVKQRKLDDVADRIKERFGMGAIGRGARLMRDEGREQGKK